MAVCSKRAASIVIFSLYVIDRSFEHTANIIESTRCSPTPIWDRSGVRFLSSVILGDENNSAIAR